jgi:hypothetical protein
MQTSLQACRPGKAALCITISLLLCWVWLLLANAIPAHAQPATTKTLLLKASSNPISLQHVYIQHVQDFRSDTQRLGLSRSGLKANPIEVKGGAGAAIQDFVETQVIQNRSSDTFRMEILELQLNEKVVKGVHHANLRTKVGFSRNGRKVVDFSGTGTMQYGTASAAHLARLVAQNLEQALCEFDTWWPKNKSKYQQKRAGALQVTVQFRKYSRAANEIIYKAETPLTISDFQGTPDEESKALAATYSGFSLQYSFKSDTSGNFLDIELFPYFDRSKSWMKKGGKTPYVLRHEQLHFDITALKTYDFLRALKHFKFSAEGFQTEIEQLKEQYSKELEAMQELYDRESNHGSWRDKQKAWDRRITTELAEKAAAAGI